MKAKSNTVVTKTSLKVLSLILTTKAAARMALHLLLNYESQKIDNIDVNLTSIYILSS